MRYTEKQIALMAKLVPELTDNAWSRQGGKPMVVGDEWRGAYVMREWQPWSDWRDLGPLFLACYGWWDKHHAEAMGDPEIWLPLVEATNTSDFDAFATAVCNLAIEIGEVSE